MTIKFVQYLLLLLLSSCTQHQNKTISEQNPQIIENKQRGAHIFGIDDSTYFQSLKQNNIEWVTLVAWSFQDDYNSSELNHHNNDSVRIQQTNAAWLNRIKATRAAGFKVFLKPHIWLNTPSNNTWRSDIFPKNEGDWKLWKTAYRDFILRYALIAEQAQADMFCMGTELTRLSLEKSAFWEQLIQEVRAVYTGKLTYAANWYEEFEGITFWEDLDFIGIQAYFPLVENDYPSVAQISKGWNKYLPKIEAIHDKYHRKIIFTEMGYKSTASSAARPWEWVEDPATTDAIFSVETQTNCYQSFFDTVWNEDWFAGVHIWQLRSDFDKEDKYYDLDFTPQGKPALTIIAKGFKQYKNEKHDD